MSFQFKATIQATAILPAPHHVENLTAEGLGDSKPAARTRAENQLREKLNYLRQAHGPNVLLQATTAPTFEEVPNA